MNNNNYDDDDLVLDFSQVSDNYEAIPKGVYPAYFFDVQKGLSQNKEPKLIIIFKISDGPYKGRQLWMNPSLQQQSLFRIKKLAKTIGSTLNFEGGVKVSQIIATLINQPCRIMLDCDKTLQFPNSVVEVLPPRGGETFPTYSRIKKETTTEKSSVPEEVEKTQVEKIGSKNLEKEKTEELTENDLPV